MWKFACLLIFMVTVTTTNGDSNDETKEMEPTDTKHITKREAYIFDSLPVESVKQLRRNMPFAVMKKVNRQHLKSYPLGKLYKPKSLSVSKMKNFSRSKKQMKKYKAHKPIKYRYSKNQMANRPTRNRQNYNSRVPQLNKVIKSYTPQQPTGFGEPPRNINMFRRPFDQGNGEPPLDYNKNIPPPNMINPINTVRDKLQPQTQINEANYENFPPYHTAQYHGNKNSNLDIATKYTTLMQDSTSLPSEYLKNTRFNEAHKNMIVGGQYAEPPPRYIIPSNGKTFVPPGKYSQDLDMAGSSLQSSYVNYKSSNLAFSPQNLNDAFSITDYSIE